jgi:predicted AlkP superfamily phosphohydrolase/phosphomutase
METDRLHHFFFKQMEEGDPIWKPAFYDIYRRIDSAIARVRELLRPKDTLILVSDHGFCSIQKEVYLNAALADAGYLNYTGDPINVRGPKLEIVAPSSKAFVIDPGRIVINLKGREKTGSVSPSDYERIRSELVEWAETLKDPDTGNRVIERAYRREEIYSGPFLESAADLILSPVNGYDPKGALWRPTIFHQDEMMVGMHTFDDAMLCISRSDIVAQAEVALEDIAPTVLQLLGAPTPPELDGKSLVQ